ncbi:MAG: DUF2911 domain-containing protein [Microscillaceae bacterium]|nr:DUF2911 domain-containing protein [Microscillaceae bacterium]MDW8461167.1 DUF2911 domain-containing protein [Cytophagales bacterium]
MNFAKIAQNFFIGIFLLFLPISKSICQRVIPPPKPKSSPLTLSFYKSEKIYVKVVYGQPHKKGRVIFGNLIPYDEVWRTGANEATEITLTRDVKIKDKLLKAGTYTLFSIPNETEWTIIFNAELGQWGAYKYEEYKDKNVLVVKVPPQVSEDEYEAFTILFDETPKGLNMSLNWDRTKVVVPFVFVD